MNGGNGREHADRGALRERLSAYLDGELAPADAAALERHLAECAECRDELAALREVRTLLRALPQPPLPRSFVLPPTTAPRAVRQPSPEWPVPGRLQRAPAGPRQPAAAAAPRRVPVATIARAAQWVGSLAAVFGLLLIVATAVLGSNLGAAHTFSAAPALSGNSSLQKRTPQQTATSQRTPPGPGVAQGTGTSTPTTALTPASPTTAPIMPTQTPSADGATREPFPVLPVAGAGLLAGGLVLFGAGSVAARRRQRRGGRGR